MIQKVTPCLMNQSVDYFDRSAVSVACRLLCELKKNKEFLKISCKRRHRRRCGRGRDNGVHTCSGTSNVIRDFLCWDLCGVIPAVLLCFSQTSSISMIQEMTTCLMIRSVDYFDRSAVSVAWGLLCKLKKIQLNFLFNLANVVINDDDDAAVPRKFISYDHTCFGKLKLCELHLKYYICSCTNILTFHLLFYNWMNLVYDPVLIYL